MGGNTGAGGGSERQGEATEVRDEAGRGSKILKKRFDATFRKQAATRGHDQELIYRSGTDAKS